MYLRTVKICPVVNVSKCYNKTKLSVHNFTIYDLDSHACRGRRRWKLLCSINKHRLKELNEEDEIGSAINWQNRTSLNKILILIRKEKKREGTRHMEKNGIKGLTTT